MPASTRSTGRLRAAPMTFVLAFVAYLAITATPALASSCSLDDPTDTLTVTVTSDDQVVLAVDDGTFDGTAGDIVMSIDGSDFGPCAGADADADTDVILVSGSGSGNESVTFAEADDDSGSPFTWAADTTNGSVNIFVDLGNGTDALTFQYAALQVSATDAITDPGTNDTVQLGTTVAGDFVDQNFDADADAQIVNAEIVTINLGDGHDTIDQDSTAFPFSRFADFTTNTPNNEPFEHAFTANGGAGDDFVDSGLANDTFNGGPGDDEISVEFALAPGATVDLAAGTTSGGAGADTLTGVQDILGSHLDDVLIGNAFDNDIDGTGGDDVLTGGDGSDGAGTDATHSVDGLVGGPGDDELTGGPGDDIVNGDGPSNEIGPDGDDTLHEGAVASGADLLIGEGGIDVLDYGQRTTAVAILPGQGAVSGEDLNVDGDAADVGDEHDTVATDFEAYLTGTGNDRLIGGPGSESFNGGPGDDEIFGGGGGFDFVVYTGCPGGIVADMAAGSITGCADDTDTISGIEGVVGTDFDDTFLDDGANDSGDGCFLCADPAAPESGDNAYVGLDGDDTFVQPVDPDGANDDGDVIEGGEGTDFLDLSTRPHDIEGSMDGDGTCAGFPVECTFGPDSDFADGDEHGGEGDDWSGDLEDVTTGSGADEVVGNDQPNVIDTGAGNDEAFGDDGNDTFLPGPGDDDVHGEDGNDQLSTFEPAGAAVSLGDGADVFDGGTGFDWYDASGRTESQNLTIDRECFQDDGLFGEGDGLCFVEGVVGGSGADFLAGNNANNVLDGGPGDDSIQGLKGRDSLVGDLGDDRLSGAKGPDALDGGEGVDRGVGGGGPDTCVAVETMWSCTLM